MDDVCGTILAKNTTKVAFLDYVTWKPAPALPDWWTRKYSGLAVDNEKLMFDPVGVPERAFACKVTVPWSAAGTTMSAIYFSFPEFYFDAAMRAMQAGFYSKFRPGDDILNHHVKKMDVSYKGMSQPGKTIEISTWEDEGNPLLLHFDSKVDGKSINQSSMEFYAKLSASL